jgi:hypothetical protein
VHLVVQHAGLNFPPWLNEGIAELYSTLKPLGEKVVVGNLIAGHVQALYAEKWVPLAVILGAGHDSPYYNEKNKAGSLYNEGWALVHMLALNQDYRPKFSALLNAIVNGSPSIMALEQTYGKPLAVIEKDLQAYLRGDRFSGVLIPAKLIGEKTPLPAEPAASFDVKLALADLSNQPGKQSDTEERFKELTRDDPQRPEPWAGLAYLAWGRGKMEDTEQNFAKAYLLGARSPRLLGTAAAWLSTSTVRKPSRHSMNFSSNSPSEPTCAWNLPRRSSPPVSRPTRSSPSRALRILVRKMRRACLLCLRMRTSVWATGTRPPRASLVLHNTPQRRKIATARTN